MLKIGDTLPDFMLPDQDGNDFYMHKIVGKKNLVVYFYPKDESVACTMEACKFRDYFEDFINYECDVIGISGDSVESHQRFSRNLGLPFVLLSDEENKIRKKFGVPRNLFGLLPGRVSYIVDKKGVIRHIVNSQLNIKKHVNEAIMHLQKIS
jgi:peroxiredoxin Q/BCP